MNATADLSVALPAAPSLLSASLGFLGTTTALTLVLVLLGAA